MNPHLRASDADREQMVAALRRHVGAGRLTLDEFSERCARAYEARTAGDLAALSEDLPRDEEPTATAAPASVEGGRRGWALAGLAVAALAGAALAGGFVEMAAAAGSMMDAACH